ncbi:hypothetical protein T552_03328 [Pneumocystis carinii B80]|uniref:60S ribosomal protein L8 n=1 Tax=Pneumocystis carinii (strain B80) TaxID=1408658 RepID=A0A0W4ZBA1_PNEC8|nr:hypothetical protein T552_03328 [Pneumocystis carinii B80]KTW25716.1 hypothetical protein T552_03328 [Pneumocystis carinii B80]
MVKIKKTDKPSKSNTVKKTVETYPIKKATSKSKNLLFEKKPKNFSIGQDIQPKRDLTRFVKWPRYVQIQRQKRILSMRLKVPPAISQFSFTLEKNIALELFRLLNKYRPETKIEKKQRLLSKAEDNFKGVVAKDLEKKPFCVKSGLNHIVSLIENKKASLVIIANDVDPIELVVYLPSLCRKMGVPYCIIKNKARLGIVVHRKTSAVLAFTEVRFEDKNTLATLISAIRVNYNDKYDEFRRIWGGGIMGKKLVSINISM